MTWLAWLRLPPNKVSSRQMLQHINRVKMSRAFGLQEGIERLAHQNQLIKLARDGGQMTPYDLAKFEPQQRHATLTEIVVERAPRSLMKSSICTTASWAVFSTRRRKSTGGVSSGGKAINDKIRQYSKIG
ncbi:protein of unknown function [Cupriavidus taiwanensis]|uniref:Uncharacterized protein n=1 Tax=Cupriavidus taiwanensis TaxID=164546 RepID=A0A375I970_9BURK|nr:hypothetical protein [Cupriavidus taiwanensis]SPK71363.1 protein of unknown function [Cupriavidus taiwanensis]